MGDIVYGIACCTFFKKKTNRETSFSCLFEGVIVWDLALGFQWAGEGMGRGRVGELESKAGLFCGVWVRCV